MTGSRNTAQSISCETPSSEDRGNTWRIIDSGPAGAAWNMALDEALALQVRSGLSPTTLRLYCWDRPAISLGCFQKSSDIDAEFCRDRGIPIVRRPTGGRAILHGKELTYCFSAATGIGPFSKGLLDSYKKISAAFQTAFNKIGVQNEPLTKRERGEILSGSPLCFQSGSFGEILANRRKLLGSAQKRWDNGLLQQGCLPYEFNRQDMARAFMLSDASRELDCMTALKEIVPSFDEAVLKETIKACFEETFGVSLVCSLPSAEELALARRLEETKYLQPEWNFRM